MIFARFYATMGLIAYLPIIMPGTKPDSNSGIILSQGCKIFRAPKYTSKDPVFCLDNGGALQSKLDVVVLFSFFGIPIVLHPFREHLLRVQIKAPWDEGHVIGDTVTKKTDQEGFCRRAETVKL